MAKSFVDTTINYVSANPWTWAAGAGLVLFVVMSGNRGGAGGGGITPEMALKSQEITTQANIAMSQIAADSNAQIAQSNAQYIGFMRDIALGAQAVAMDDNQANTAAMLGAMQTNAMLIDASNQTAGQLAVAAMGYENTKQMIAANKEIQNYQTYTTNAAIFESLATDRFLAGKNYDALVHTNATGERIAMADINAMLESSALSAALNRDLSAQQFGFMDRSEDRYYTNQDMLTNNQLRIIHQYGKEERRTAKQQGMFDIFKAGIGAIGQAVGASQGVPA